MSLSAAGFLDIYSAALRGRAKLDSANHAAPTWEGGYVVEPFFPGFRITFGEAVSYRLSEGFSTFPIEHGIEDAVARLMAYVAHAGLAVGFVARPGCRSWASLFVRQEILLPSFMKTMPHETFFCLTHELAHFAMHRTRPRDPELVERETRILQWMIAASVSEHVQPMNITVASLLPLDFEFVPTEYRPKPPRPPIRSKRQMIASADRVMRGAAMIEDLFR